MESKKPSFLGISGSIMAAIWATVYPRVLPKVDQAWSSGRSSVPVKSTWSRSPSTVTVTCRWTSGFPRGSWSTHASPS
ncbi:MAG: hypothetical protein U5R31_09835 [Acidimicrobiia bacterium]|nr:hypothetical protein [Acidimicrobiia bacterium]